MALKREIYVVWFSYIFPSFLLGFGSYRMNKMYSNWDENMPWGYIRKVIIWPSSISDLTAFTYFSTYMVLTGRSIYFLTFRLLYKLFGPSLAQYTHVLTREFMDYMQDRTFPCGFLVQNDVWYKKIVIWPRPFFKPFQSTVLERDELQFHACYKLWWGQGNSFYRSLLLRHT